MTDSPVFGKDGLALGVDQNAPDCILNGLSDVDFHPGIGFGLKWGPSLF